MAGKVDVAFDDLGEQSLKNIARSLRVYQVRLGEVPATDALPDKPSIAVLPFANMSGDPEQECYAEMAWSRGSSQRSAACAGPRAIPIRSLPGGWRGGMTQTRRLATILAADLARYLRLMRADEGGALERLKALPN